MNLFAKNVPREHSIEETKKKYSVAEYPPYARLRRASKGLFSSFPRPYPRSTLRGIRRRRIKNPHYDSAGNTNFAYVIDTVRC